MDTDRSTSPPDLVIAAMPVAAAIGVFGVVYGAAARPLLGGPLTLLSSVIVFSGAAQFTLLALLAAGAGTGGIVGAIALLALRHLPLGAVLLPRLPGVGRPRRALVSLLLLDETTGLALTRPGPPDRTLMVSGSLAYGAWIAGTAAGVAGASLAAAEPLAEALFPVLFVGLAALTSTSRSDTVRAVLAGAGSVALLLAVPGAGALGVLVVAVVVSALATAP